MRADTESLCMHLHKDFVEYKCVVSSIMHHPDLVWSSGRCLDVSRELGRRGR
jgi:hypothetical protein